VNTLHSVVAIDGPAASGKSSVARLLASKLRFLYVNSGAMYRALTWHFLNRNINSTDVARIVAALPELDFLCDQAAGESTIRINGIDPSAHLCDQEVNENVSAVSTIPEVRQLLVARQRAYLERDNIVMEGRDIGSAVFPETPYKFYIDASPEVRAQRRARQGQQDEIAARDRWDSTRRLSPLIIAEDAFVIDSSHLTVDGVVGEIIGRLKLKGLQIPERAG
jgi:cytidylate kinase